MSGVPNAKTHIRDRVTIGFIHLVKSILQQMISEMKTTSDNEMSCIINMGMKPVWSRTYLSTNNLVTWNCEVNFDNICRVTHDVKNWII